MDDVRGLSTTYRSILTAYDVGLAQSRVNKSMTLTNMAAKLTRLGTDGLSGLVSTSYYHSSDPYG
jgi:hypothetical protein